MTPVLIIGYGNPLRSDDGIGWHAAQSLLNEWPADQVRVEAAHQLLPEMAAWIGDADCVIFIDAYWDAVPGRIRSHGVRPEKTVTASMTHHFSPQGLLANARQLFYHAPGAVLVTVGGSSFEHGEALSPTVAAALPDLLTQVKKIVRGALAKTAHGSSRQPDESAKGVVPGKVESHA